MESTAAHFGFLDGSGRWLGPSVEQDMRAQEIDAEVQALHHEDPAQERMRRFLQDDTATTVAQERDAVDGWHPDAMDVELARADEEPAMAPTADDAADSPAVQRERAEVMDFLASFQRPVSSAGLPPAARPVEVVEASAGCRDQEGDGLDVKGGPAFRNQALEHDSALGRDQEGDETLRDSGWEGVDAHVAPGADGSEWGEMRGKFRERASMPLRAGQTFLHVVSRSVCYPLPAAPHPAAISPIDDALVTRGGAAQLSLV